MGKMKSALMDWNLENGWDICATGHNRRPTLVMVKNAHLRAKKKRKESCTSTNSYRYR